MQKRRLLTILSLTITAYALVFAQTPVSKDPLLTYPPQSNTVAESNMITISNPATPFQPTSDFEKNHSFPMGGDDAKSKSLVDSLALSSSLLNDTLSALGRQPRDDTVPIVGLQISNPLSRKQSYISGIEFGLPKTGLWLSREFEEDGNNATSLRWETSW